jgi:branched-chain amino acid transport system substrate-binding protein
MFGLSGGTAMTARCNRLLAAGALTLVGCWGVARAEIPIGAAAPLTGPNLWVGEDTKRGIEMSAADLNAAGGVLGEPLRLLFADDYCDPEQAAVAANTLVAAGVVVVVGHPCSGAAIPAAEVYEAAGVPVISSGATNSKLTGSGRRNVFRVVGRDDRQGALAGDYLADQWGDRRIAIVHDGQAYGQGLAEETKRRLNERGVEEALYEVVTPGDADYSELVAKMQAAGIDVLYFGGYAPEAGLILHQAHDLGDDLRLVGGDGLASGDFWLLTGDAGEGTLITFFPDPRTNPAAAPVVERFRAEGVEPKGQTLYAYAAVQVWAQAAEAAGRVDGGAVIEARRDRRFDTVLGSIGFDDKGDVTGIEPFAWYVWTDGDYLPVE